MCGFYSTLALAHLFCANCIHFDRQLKCRLIEYYAKENEWDVAKMTNDNNEDDDNNDYDDNDNRA